MLTVNTPFDPWAVMSSTSASYLKNLTLLNIQSGRLLDFQGLGLQPTIHALLKPKRMFFTRLSNTIYSV